MLKCHLKCDIARWDRELSPPPLFKDVHHHRHSEGGGVVSLRRLNRRDMRQTVRVTDKQPWSLGATSGEKHCLGIDNKLLPRQVTAARPMAGVSHRDLNSLSLKGMSSLSVADT